MDSTDFKRKLTAILSADVAGYSRLMGDDEAATVRTLNKYKKIIFGLIKQNNGRLVDSPGDNVLAEFASVVDAVKCAVQVQKDLKEQNYKLPANRKMEFRIGINIGDVIQNGDRIYGDGVNVAARIESLADSGGICVSRTAYDQVKSKIAIDYEYLGEYEVKNIKEPVRVYKVLMGLEAIGKIIGERRRSEVISRKKNIAIAVLPFDNLSSEKDQEYFVDGLTEEILNYISKISDLHVTSKTSSFAFKNTHKTIQEIAEILGRDYILEGSVRKAGNSLRITAQLIHVADDRHIWSEAYNRELKDIFKIQEEIAINVAHKLKLTLESIKLLGGTENIAAYEQYLVAQGKYRGYTEGVSDLTKYLDMINTVIDMDTEFALAWALKAELHYLETYWGSPGRSVAESDYCIDAAHKTIEIEPNLPNGYITLGAIKMFKSEWLEAEINFRKALELIGVSLSGEHWVIIPFYISVGKYIEAHELLDKMRKNDPLNERFLNWYYFTFSLLGDRQRAEDEYKSRKDLMSKGWSTFHDDFITFTRIGFCDVVSNDEILSANPIFDIGNKYFESPKEGLEELRGIYKSDSKLSSMYLSRLSLLAAYFGDHEFALEVLEKGAGISSDLIPCWFPVMKEVRQLPRFKEFVREIGLVDYWKKYGWPDLCRPVGDDDFECD